MCIKETGRHNGLSFAKNRLQNNEEDSEILLDKDKESLVFSDVN